MAIVFAALAVWAAFCVGATFWWLVRSSRREQYLGTLPAPIGAPPNWQSLRSFPVHAKVTKGMRACRGSLDIGHEALRLTSGCFDASWIARNEVTAIDFHPSPMFFFQPVFRLQTTDGRLAGVLFSSSDETLPSTLASLGWPVPRRSR